MVNIALIAHDKKKDDLVSFVTAYQDIFPNTVYLLPEQQGEELTRLPAFQLCASSPDRLEEIKKLVQ